MIALEDLPIRHFTVDEVDRMVEAGILDEDEPVELIDGVLEAVSPQSEDHAWLLDVIERALRGAYAPEHVVRSQRPLRAGDRSRPEPDIAVLSGPLERYHRRYPRCDEALLLVEVSVSTLERDHRKARVYAEAGAPELWIVDVAGRRLEIHTEPGPDGYGVVTLLGESRAVTPPGTTAKWKIAELLP